MGLYDITVTTAGAALLAAAAANEKELTFTRGELGSGIVTGDYSGVTALSNYVCDASLDTATITDSVISVPVLFSNKSGGVFMNAFTLNELGLFGKADGEEVLIAYANAGTSGEGLSIPGDTLTEFTYVFKIAFSSKITVTIDASAISYASQEYIDSKLSGKADAVHTHAISDVTGLTDTLDGKAAASHTHAASDITGLAETYSVTLSAASWSGGAYTVSNSAFGADSKLIMALSESASAEQAQACRDAMIRVTAHAAGSITLTADGDVPGVDVPIVIIRISG